MQVNSDQHFMVDLDILNRIVKAADARKGETILEIGAGTGNLTRVLANSGAKVIAIEIDPELSANLKERFSGEKNIEVVEGNALKLIKKLKFDKIISNIPYAICEPLLQLLKEVSFEKAVITIPNGFLERLTSGTKLGLESNIFFKIKKLFSIPKEAFAPEPDTESVAMLLKPKKTILRSVLVRPKAKLKNAIMEALVEREKCTKNQASEAIKALNISNNIGEKLVADMNLNDLRQLISKIKD